MLDHKDAFDPGFFPRAILAPDVHFSELTPPEQRVLGCLIEKRWTTPDQYPLSLNALRLACNQSTNRDPVTDYDEHTVREAAQRLSKYGLARLASGHSSRAIKYRHLAEESLGLGREELAVLALLLLRGPQTPGELKGRSERMARIESLEAVDGLLEALAERGYVRRLERRPGQKEDRFMHLLGGADAAEERIGMGSADGAPSVVAPAPAHAPAPFFTAPAAVSPRTAAPAAVSPRTAGPAAVSPRTAGPAAVPASTPAQSDGALERRLAALEAEVAALRDELVSLRGELGG